MANMYTCPGIFELHIDNRLNDVPKAELNAQLSIRGYTYLYESKHGVE